MTLIDGDIEKSDKIYSKIKKFGPLISIISYFAGLIYFCLLPHDQIVHRTYISENALLPGLVSSDIFSTDLLNNYYNLLKSHLESQKNNDFDQEYIKELFEKKVQIETYVQHFNLTHPFISESSDSIMSGKNVYAFGRAARADGTESIVVSAPLYIKEKRNSLIPNLIGISQLMALADLVRTRPYWAKDLVFVVSDMGHIGIQAWINSYYDINSEYIKGENLKRRAGSIQAALNLEIKDDDLDKIEIKLEGANGKVPNLDLFNTVIRICKTIQFKCSLESEKSFQDYSYYQDRIPLDHLAGIENTVSMIFKQATGVPTSSHGFFLNHRIEALTISGVKSSKLKRQNSKQNLLKVTRIIESTLRSVNNLLERFHQSFFFYLLPSSQFYISIGMYMPVFGLIVLPILVQIVSIWCEIFFKKPNQQFNNSENSSISFNVFRLVIPNLLISAAFGLILYFGTPYFLYYGKKFNLSSKDSLLNCYIAVTVNIISAPILVNSKISLRSDMNPVQRQYIKTTSDNLIKLFVLLELVIFLGTLSLLNFSLALLIAIFYVPVSILSIANISSTVIKILRTLLLVLSTPLLYFSCLYVVYAVHFEKVNLTKDVFQLFDTMSYQFYEMALLSKVSNIWTYDLINLCLIPIWTSLWFLSFPRFY